MSRRDPGGPEEIGVDARRAHQRAEQTYAYASRANTPDAWLVAADAAEEASNQRAAIVYRFFATIAPRSVRSSWEIINGLRRLGAPAIARASGVRLGGRALPLTAMPTRGMKRRRFYALFQALATYFVGDSLTELYFLSNRGGVVAIFSDRDDAIDHARFRDLYVEGPSGEEWHASWA